MEPNNGTITQGTPYQRSILERIIGKNYDDIPVFRHLMKAGENFKNSAPGKVINFLMPDLSNGMMGAVTPGTKLANPEIWEGIEDAASTLTKYHRGYNGQAPILKYTFTKQPKTINVSSTEEKLYQLPSDKVNNMVRIWNGEKYNTIDRLKRNPKDYQKFLKWLEKH